MRRLALTCFAFASLALAACSSGKTGSPEEPTAESQSRIYYGTTDSTHTAVVALLNPDQGGYDECSGTIVQVTGGVGYVLTAAHCCNSTQPTIVVMSSDYSSSVQYISSSNPQAPAYAVIAGSVKFDPGYNGNSSAPIDDFCMLKFNAPANAPVIPVAVGNDGLSVGTTVEYVGFGTTQSNQNNSLREHASAPVDQSVNANYFRYTEGGSTHIGGPCEGDSGGPALLPAGAAQAQQKVVGTTSYGDTNCQQYGVSMRVTSQTGPGGFISTYLGTTSSSSSTSSTSSSTSSSSGGAPTDCTGADGTIGCCDGNVNWYCTQAGTLTSTTCSGGKVCGWSASNGYYDCVAAPGGSDPSGMSPIACNGGSSSTSTTGTSSSGGQGCGLTTNDPTCDACLTASCCSEETACATEGQACITCIQNGCTTDQVADAFLTCAGNNCNTQCGGSSGTGGSGGAGTGNGSSSGFVSSSGLASSSGSGSGNGAVTSAASSSGFGVGGAGTTGTGFVSSNGATGTGADAASGGGSPGADSGCSVAPGAKDPASPASLAGLLLGAALMFSRRRR